MGQEFKPSQKSYSPENEVLARITYLKRAAEALEAYVTRNGVPPTWVIDRLNQSVTEAGMAVSFVQYAEKQVAEQKADIKPKRGKKP